MRGKKIILGISGSIAAYKAVILLRALKKAGADVRVVATDSLEHFVGELTLSSLSGHKVFRDLWAENWSEHVTLGTWADLMVVAPATANTLAKLANGLCDNALTAVYLAARCPVMLAPAMDADMYIHPRTQANLSRLSADGCTVLPVGNGFLASGLEGPGRMMEPEEIFERITDFFAQKRPLAGKKLLLTAGPTREALDPVRYLTNHSSGKMGYALAQEAARMGAEVTLVSGPTHLPAPEGVTRIGVNSAQDMYEAVMAHADTQDILIMAAAVADYTPVEVADRKIKKKESEFVLTLKKTTDILASLGKLKQPRQLLIGFALETDNELENARKKLQAKNADLIVLNSLQDSGAGFSHDTNQITLVGPVEEVKHFPLKSKQEAAKDILEAIHSLYLEKTGQ
ncbi:MAG: bifunctional phosphopantothenoylcysteine decarboxylase/phosphopantothenate--cysteine ligase CoaBC [Bacteroidetes bacterium]|nr:MAG: bifunctional phosphopantothenoylcysteine decarboxylase/phosphopantothenate--cysteine ligase CoaBC [Bacteroidota bacterium]